MQRITYTQGNTFSVSVPMIKKMVEKVGNTTTITTEDYIPNDGDVLEVRLIGDRRQYRYTPTTEGNVAVFTMQGNELAGRYGIEVNVLCANGERMRFADPHAIELVPFTGIVDNFIVGEVSLGASVFFAMRGEKGDPGDDGNGIVSITKTGTSGLVDTYTITYTDGTSSTFTVTNGEKGAPGATGATGVGILGIEKTSSHGLVDTYTITFSNHTTTTFQVTNGAQGATGADGRGITSIVETTTTQESGGRNVVTVTLTDGSTSTFDVYNGQAGADAEEELEIIATKNGDYYNLSYTWYELKTRVNNGHDKMFVHLPLPNSSYIKLPFVLIDDDDFLFFAADVDMPVGNSVWNTKHFDLFYGDDGFAILTETPLSTPLFTVSGSTPTQQLEPNSFYKFGTVTSLTLTLGTAISGKLNIYAGKFTAGTSFAGLSVPIDVSVADGSDTPADGDVCEFSILDNVIIIRKIGATS